MCNFLMLKNPYESMCLFHGGANPYDYVFVQGQKLFAQSKHFAAVFPQKTIFVSFFFHTKQIYQCFRLCDQHPHAFQCIGA